MAYNAFSPSTYNAFSPSALRQRGNLESPSPLHAQNDVLNVFKVSLTVVLSRSFYL